MTFHISQELLFERAIVVWATILLFGLVSIGGLWLWRRLSLSADVIEEKTAERLRAMAAENDAALVAAISRYIHDKTIATLEIMENESTAKTYPERQVSR